MLSRIIRAMLDDSHRGDDRTRVGGGADSPAAVPNAGDPRVVTGKPAVMRRRTVNLMVILGIAAIVYGTFAPFEIDPNRRVIWQLDWQVPASGDAVANVLIYVPIGAFLRLLLRRRGSWRLWECAGSLLVASGMSYLTEVGQTVVPARVPTWTDTLCNTVGAAIGIALAPTFQRLLRNLHAWLYHELRVRPMRMAASTALICLCICAMAPFDFHPTPGHLANAIWALAATPASAWWASGPGVGGWFGPIQVMDKIVAAGSYGLLAFLLVLSAREAGKTPSASAWYALTRSAALAVAVEALQLFTISHVAHVRDLFSAWVCGGLGSAVGWALVCRWPALHQRPVLVLQGVVMTIGLILLAWAAGSLMLETRADSPMPICWLPLVGNFQRTWNGLLGDYTTGLLQYTLVAGLIVLWYRSNHQSPRVLVVVGVPVISAMLAGVVAVHRHGSFDTAQILLAVLAGVVAMHLDRATFGRRTVAASPAI